jgi:DNA repair exonuclease SbcCD ATPase subunit
MEAELRKLLEPIIAQFIQSLTKTREVWEAKYRSALSQINESLSQELDKTQKERDNLKTQKEENEKSSALTKAKLEDAVAKQTTLNDELNKQAAQYYKLSKELEEKLKEIEENHANSKLERESAVHTSEQARNLQAEYRAKLNSLKVDFDKLALQKDELAEREQNVKAKEKANLNESTRLTEEAHRQNDIDLKLRAREAEISRLIKRYKLEQSIKEG